MLGQEVEVGIVEGGAAPGRHGDPGTLEHLPGLALVVTDAQGDRARQLGEGFQRPHGPAPVGEHQAAPGSVEDVDGDAPQARLVNDDPGVDVQLVVAAGKRNARSPHATSES